MDKMKIIEILKNYVETARMGNGCGEYWDEKIIDADDINNIADDILGLCFSEVVSPAEPLDSEWLMCGARQRFKELKDYEYGWKSFYAGWVEGRAHVKKAKAGSGGTPV